VVGVGSVAGLLGVEGVLDAETMTPVASDDFVRNPIEFVAVTSTLMYLSTSLEVSV
jgi:hypothetical protein